MDRPRLRGPSGHHRPSTRVVDAAGKALVPGLIDGTPTYLDLHRRRVHPLCGGQRRDHVVTETSSPSRWPGLPVWSIFSTLSEQPIRILPPRPL